MHLLAHSGARRREVACRLGLEGLRSVVYGLWFMVYGLGFMVHAVGFEADFEQNCGQNCDYFSLPELFPNPLALLLQLLPHSGARRREVACGFGLEGLWFL